MIDHNFIILVHTSLTRVNVIIMILEYLDYIRISSDVPKDKILYFSLEMSSDFIHYTLYTCPRFDVNITCHIGRRRFNIHDTLDA